MVRALLRANRELRGDGAIGDAEFLADDALCEAVDDAQCHHLAAAIGERLDGFGQESEFLVASDMPGNTFMVIQDV